MFQNQTHSNLSSTMLAKNDLKLKSPTSHALAMVGHMFKNKNTRFTDISGTKLHIWLNIKNGTCQIAHLTKYAILSQKCR